MDVLAILYIVFCFIICGFGIWVYSRKKNDVPLYLGIAFGLYTIDRLVVFLGLPFSWGTFGVVLRIAAYLLVLFALYRLLVKKQTS
jgi:hypothetical protein